MTRVRSGELDYDEETGLVTHNGTPFTGVAFELRADGRLESESEMLDGLNWGVSRTWYPDGSLLAESESLNGALHGRAREWHNNGQLAEDGEYEYGIVLWEKEWSEEGQLLKDYKMQSKQQREMLEHRRRVYGPLGDSTSE